MSYNEKIANLEQITIEHLIDLKGIIAVIRDSIGLPKNMPMILTYHDINQNKVILNSNKDLFKAIIDCSNRTDIDNPDDMYIIISIMFDNTSSNFIRITFLNKLQNRI